jgi:DDRGK domain-containing protein 1
LVLDSTTASPLHYLSVAGYTYFPDMLTALDLLPLLLLAGIFGILLVVLWRVRNASASDQGESESGPVSDPTSATDSVTQQGQDGPRRRRGGLARMRAAVDQGGDAASENVVGDQEMDESAEGSAEHGGGSRKTKKDANREAKRAAREEHEARLVAQRERLEKAEEERIAAKRAEDADELEAEERARAEAEEKRKKEEDEYSQWKDLISVEEAGDEGEGAQEEDPAMLARFISYIKHNKIVVLEELAAEFGLKTEDAILRLNGLEEGGTVTGVFDDRGKFIYVSPEEMKAVADFITRRGRVSIAELAAESSKLLHLEDAAVAL